MRNSSVAMWLGDLSFPAALTAYRWKMTHPTEAAEPPKKFEDETDLIDFLADSIYQEKDNVAIITVSGSMTNEDSFWNYIFGLTSYNTVAAALNRAVEDPDITDIVMNYSTSGGDAEGIGAVSENIKIANSIKPVYSFSNTKALSAGYWMAASGSKIYGSPMSEWGSIGAILVHTSMADAIKERGYEVTIFRGGKYKALGHPAEKLSEKAKNLFKGKAEKLYNFFLREISGERPSLKVENSEEWADGKVFFADEALSVGLIDKIMTFNELVSSLIKEVDEGEQPEIPGTAGLLQEDETMKTVILDAAAQAQVASGVALSEVNHQEVEPAAPAVDPANPAAPVVDADPAAPVDLADPVEPVAPVVDADPEPAPEPAPTEIVQFLKSELATVREELGDTKQTLATLETKADQDATDVESLKVIAIEATQRLQVALGQSPVAMDGMTAEVIQQQYATSKKAFSARFKVGQQSLGVDEASTESSSVEADARKFGIVPKAEA